MRNPTTTNFVQSGIFKACCRFDDRAVEIPALATLTAGTVLGILTDSKETNQGSLGSFESDKSNGLEIPVAVLAQDYVNSVKSVVKKTLRVCLLGEVDGGNLVFKKDGDGVNTLLKSGKLAKDELKTQGILVLNIIDTTV